MPIQLLLTTTPRSPSGGWYKGDQDEAIIDTDVFVENAKKFGSFCAANPTISIVNAAEKILGN